MSFQVRSYQEELKQEEDLLRTREKEVQARREARRLREARQRLSGTGDPRRAGLQEQLQKQRQREQQLEEALRELQPFSRIQGGCKEGQWLLRIGALQDELKQKIEKVNALKAKEEQLEAELRDRLHADAELLPALRLAAAELCAAKDAGLLSQTQPRLSLDTSQVPQLPERQVAAHVASLSQVPQLPARQSVVVPQVPQLPERQPVVPPASLAEVPPLPERQPMQVPQLPERQGAAPVASLSQVPQLPARQSVVVPQEPQLPDPQPVPPTEASASRGSSPAVRTVRSETRPAQAVQIQSLPVRQVEVPPEAAHVSTSACLRSSPSPGLAEVQTLAPAASVPQDGSSASVSRERSTTSIRRLDASLPETDKASEDFCSQCGVRYSLDAFYCRACGNRRKVQRSASVVDATRAGIGIPAVQAANVLTLPLSSRRYPAGQTQGVPGPQVLTAIAPPVRSSSLRLPVYAGGAVAASIAAPIHSGPIAPLQTVPVTLPGRRFV